MSVVHKLEPGTPEEVGLSAPGLQEAGALLEDSVAQGQINAASLLVARSGRVALRTGFGTLRPEPGSEAVAADSVYLLASITKPLTAVALMILVDRGLVSLDDPVSLHLPEFIGVARTKIKVRQLLSHTSGMPDMLPNNADLRRAHRPLSDFVEGALRTNLLYEPGTSFRYQSKGILLAAEIVERISGRRLRDFERAEIFQPLGMSASELGLKRLKIEETVWCGTSVQQSEDEARWGPNSPYWRDMGCPWGGMHSTVDDLAVLLQCMLNGGSYDGHRLLSEAATEAMVTNQNSSHLDAPWGLGWALRDSKVWAFFGELVSARTFGHVGATGTVAWADPERDLICVCLTNEKIHDGSLLRRVGNAVVASVE